MSPTHLLLSTLTSLRKVEKLYHSDPTENIPVPIRQAIEILYRYGFLLSISLHAVMVRFPCTSSYTGMIWNNGYIVQWNKNLFPNSSNTV